MTTLMARFTSWLIACVADFEREELEEERETMNIAEVLSAYSLVRVILIYSKICYFIAR